MSEPDLPDLPDLADLPDLDRPSGRTPRVVAAVGLVAIVAVGAFVMLRSGGGGGDDDTGDGVDSGTGSDNPAALSAEQTQVMDAALEYADCMREHGIEMEDPTAESDGSVALPMVTDRSINPKAELTTQPQAYQDAVAACEDALTATMPNQSLSPQERAELQDQLTEWANCMRAKGHDIPDPEIDENGGIHTDLGQNTDREQTRQDIAACDEEVGMDD